jgi:ADP-heptose:LPS heptosyltransferase
MKIEKYKVRNILFIRNDRFGEFLLNIPALRALKETFVQARLIALVNPYVKELAQSIPYIDEVITWENKKHSILETIGLVNLIRNKHIDIAIVSNPSKKFNICSYLTGIPIRVGYDRKWGFLLTHKMQDKKHLGQKHEIEYNLELVSLIGAKTNDLTLSLKIDDKLPEEFRKFDLEHQTNLIALHPWTSDPIKQWPINSFFELAERLIKELKLRLVVIGGKEEMSRSAEFCSNLNTPVLINLTGKTTLGQLATLLKKCSLLISGDSGPVHLAACVGAPVLAIFRNDLAGKSAKRWGPWGKGHQVIEKPNLIDITPEELFDNIKGLLKL